MTERRKLPAGPGLGTDLRPGDTAAYWEKHRATIRGMFHPVTEALIGNARIAPGDAVLDVATGSGEPTLSIAEVIGPAGLVVGIDPLSEMIAAAERAATDRHFSENTRFQVASVDRVLFEADRFDAVVSRFGIMFFSSPVECVREQVSESRYDWICASARLVGAFYRNLRAIIQNANVASCQPCASLRNHAAFLANRWSRRA